MNSNSVSNNASLGPEGQVSPEMDSGNWTFEEFFSQSFDEHAQSEYLSGALADEP